MPSEHHRHLRGQGTVEYLLLTAMVVGVMLTLFNGPLKRFVAKYTERKTQYTDVVSQKRLGIPLAWFGGAYPNPSAGGATAGGATAGETNASDPANSTNPAATASGTTAGSNPNEGNQNGGDNAGGSTQGASPGGRDNNGNLKSSINSNTDSARKGRKGKTSSGNEDEEREGEKGSGLGGGRKRGETRADGDLDKEKTKEEEVDANGVKIKKAEDSGAFGADRELFGSDRKRIKKGGCDDLDLKTVLQILFVVALLFLLVSMLFQDRGKGDE